MVPSYRTVFDILIIQEMPLSEAAVEISDKDQAEAIKMHQAALQKLQELQGNVVQAGVDLQVKSSKKVILTANTSIIIFR